MELYAIIHVTMTTNDGSNYVYIVYWTDVLWQYLFKLPFRTTIVYIRDILVTVPSVVGNVHQVSSNVLSRGPDGKRNIILIKVPSEGAYNHQRIYISDEIR